MWERNRVFSRVLTNSLGYLLACLLYLQCGIGMVVVVQGDDLVIDEIAPGGPAAQTGKVCPRLHSLAVTIRA